MIYNSLTSAAAFYSILFRVYFQSFFDSTQWESIKNKRKEGGRQTDRDRIGGGRVTRDLFTTF